MKIYNYYFSVCFRMFTDVLSMFCAYYSTSILLGFKLSIFSFSLIAASNMVLILLFGLYTSKRGLRLTKKLKLLSFIFLISFFIFSNLYSDASVVDLRYLSFIFILSLTFVVASRFFSKYLANILKFKKNFPLPSLISGVSEQTLIIGGAGYIGSSVSLDLLKRGGRVIIYDNLKFSDYTLEKIKKYPNASISVGDYLDTKLLYNEMSKCNKVVHLGGLVGDPACSINASNTIEHNLLSTKTIAELSKSLDIEKMVFASSCSVYGASDEIMFEGSQLNPVSLYAKTKVGSEEILKNYADNQHKIDILRFSTIFGISERIRFDLVLNLFVKMAVIDKKIKVIDGDQWRPFLHVNDAAGSVVHSLNHQSKTDYCIYNIGSNSNNFTIGQIADMVCSIVPGTEKVVENTINDRRNYRVNFDKMSNQLNFEPKWSAQDGIIQIKKYLEQLNVNDKSTFLDSDVFNNYKTELKLSKPNNLDWLHKSIIEV